MYAKNSIMENKNTAIEIGNEIRTVRKSLGLTLKQAGEIVGVSPATFWKYERGVVIPQAHIYKQIVNLIPH
jgi:transcriptional regulator with XRE-family HTH domain